MLSVSEESLIIHLFVKETQRWRSSLLPVGSSLTPPLLHSSWDFFFFFKDTPPVALVEAKKKEKKMGTL